MRPVELHSCFKRLRCAISFLLLAAAVAPLCLAPTRASAAGPRWVTGSPYFSSVPAGKPIVWYTSQLVYFTDPADLSPYVNHAAADSLVAAAAAVWNLPTSAIALSDVGTLNEHVSSANSYMSRTGPVFPSDVQPSNYASIPIAVIYDSDGSLTEMMLGVGASDPAGCRQNGVLENVDSITPFGYIQHAELILNGRCTGPAPEQQLQLQYQLERAFGRVLGLAWSQVNDNVFTGTPVPTDNQKLHWPIMHPIDRICGQYSYQCLPQPFTLRDDDIASISSLYPVLTATPGKTLTWQNAARISGTISFPTGEGMQGVNVLVRRVPDGSSTPQDFYDTSSVSGFLFQRNAGNPVSGPPSGISGSMGSTDPQLAGFYDLAWVPETSPQASNNMSAVVSTEPVNPLYIGPYAVGPYVPGVVTPSGSTQSATTQAPPYDGLNPQVVNFNPSDAASNCTTADGTETAPILAPASGFWSGLLCSHGHSAWSSLAMAAQRTATIEATATGETAAPSTDKAMPVLGVWSRYDLTGTLPTLDSAPSAFNTIALGVSAAHFYHSASGEIRFVIADQRGDGRPDFSYNARVLYADSVQPATIAAGAQITITGMGFTPNLQVRINGASASVLQSASTTIVATAPNTTTSGSVDIVITDPSTGGTTSMLGALTYSATTQSNRIAILSAPTGTVTAGTQAPVPFTVRVFQPDGVTPAAGIAVTFAVTTGPAQLGACGATTCMVLTDSSGDASSSITPTGPGAITINASITGASQSITFNAAQRTLTALRPIQHIAPAATITFPVQMLATENGAAAAGVPVTWTSMASLSFSPAVTATDIHGIAQSAATSAPLSIGSATVTQACAWTTICASFTLAAVDPSAWRVILVSGGSQSISSARTFLPVVARITDIAGNPIAGAPVAIHQTVSANWLPCPAHGACPIAPTLDGSTATAVSDADGLVTVTPMQMTGIGETTQIVVATGTVGFLPLSLQQTP